MLERLFDQALTNIVIVTNPSNVDKLVAEFKSPTPAAAGGTDDAATDSSPPPPLHLRAVTLEQVIFGTPATTDADAAGAASSSSKKK